jgi:peptidoglycan/LPS O-acetylase OafA/YrhL
VFERPGQGVELFFMISGFVIFSPLVGKPRSAIDGHFIANYFRRRLLRIEPPYVLLLIATYLLIVVTGYAPADSHKFFEPPKWITASLLASVVYSHGRLFGDAPRLLPPGWSLEIEIQFYILAPLIFFLYLSLGRRSRALAGAAVLLLSLLVTGATGVYAAAPHWDYTLLNFFPLFWIGILFCDFEADIRAAVERWPRVLGDVAGWGGLATLMLMAPAPAPGMLSKTLETGALVLGCLLMFVGVVGRRGLFYRVCASGWPSLLGGACYSLYLIHLQAIQVGDGVLSRLLPTSISGFPLAYFAVSALTVLPLTIACGLLFYAVVERTFMLKDWPSRFGGWLWSLIPPGRGRRPRTP